MFSLLSILQTSNYSKISNKIVFKNNYFTETIHAYYEKLNKIKQYKKIKKKVKKKIIQIPLWRSNHYQHFGEHFYGALSICGCVCLYSILAPTSINKNTIVWVA